MADRGGTFWLVNEVGHVSHEVPLPTVKAASYVPLLHRPPPPMPAAAAAAAASSTTTVDVGASVEDQQRKGGGVSRMIRTSVATAKVKAVSPPLSFAPSPRSMSPGPFGGDASLALLSDNPSDRRLLVERQFPCCTFGRHTSMKGTLYRIRHFAVSRFHFSIAFVPNELLQLFVVQSCPNDGASAVVGGSSSGDATDTAGQRKGKQSRKKPPQRKRPEHTEQTPADAKDHAALSTSPNLAASFLIFNWSLNPLFVNERPVPPNGAGALVLREGDVVSLLVSAFDPQHGVFKRERDANGEPVAMALEPAAPTGSSSFQLFAECGATPKVVDDAVAADNYDPFASPLRKGTSIRHPEPLPVFVLRRREASPETITTRHSTRVSQPAPPSPKGPPKKKKRRT